MELDVASRQDDNNDDIKVGNTVLLNKNGLNVLFANNINTLLYGKVENIETPPSFSDNKKKDTIITYYHEETGEFDYHSMNFLKKGEPNKEFYDEVKKILKYILESEELLSKAMTKNPKKFERYVIEYQLLSLYNSKKELINIKKPIDFSSKNLSHNFFVQKLSEYYSNTILMTKAKEAVDVLNIVKKYLPQYQQTEELMLCYYVYLSYKYDIDYKCTNSEPLNMGERVLYALATEHAYHTIDLKYKPEDIIEEEIREFKLLMKATGMMSYKSFIKIAIQNAVWNMYESRNGEYNLNKTYCK